MTKPALSPPTARRWRSRANYDGNPDLYTIPIEGGEPTRVTHHPGMDRALFNWAADGRLDLHQLG